MAIHEALADSQSYEAASAAGFWLLKRGTHWSAGNLVPITAVTLGLTAGSYVTGSVITLYAS